MDGPDSDDNVVVVCQSCHHKLETLYDKTFYERLGIADEQGERKTHLPCYERECDRIADYQLKGNEWWVCHACLIDKAKSDVQFLRSVDVDKKAAVGRNALQRIEADELTHGIEINE
jgi:hypothetical protein